MGEGAPIGAPMAVAGWQTPIEKARTPITPRSSLSCLPHAIDSSFPCWDLSNWAFSRQLTFWMYIARLLHLLLALLLALCCWAGLCDKSWLAAWHRLGDIHQVMTIMAWDAAS